MCSKLSDKTKQVLNKYFNAAANLYGIISLKKLLEIYNSQNEAVNEEDFLEFADDIDFTHKFFDIVGEDAFYDDADKTLLIDRDIVAEYLLQDEDFEGYYNVKEGQCGKPYYIPDKKQFIKYENEYYHEKTLSFISLRAFFRNQPNLTKERADEIADDVYGMANPLDGEIESVVSMIEDLNMFHFNDYTYKEFISLYTDMYNDTRLHINCGHTPNELYKMRW